MVVYSLCVKIVISEYVYSVVHIQCILTFCNSCAISLFKLSGNNTFFALAGSTNFDMHIMLSV